MAEKTIKTRIQLKYDTYANWTTNNPVLKAGEVAIATIPTNQDGVQNAPSILIKVGDGTSNYKTLKFVSGLAADVYDWAKAATKPEYKASEITGLADYIAGEIEDTDTQYTITKVNDYQYKLQSKAKGASTYTDTGIVIDIPKYDDTALAGRVSELEGLVGNTAVATQIANAFSAKKTLADYGITDAMTAEEIAQAIEDAQYDDTALAGRVTTVEGKVTTLIGSDTGKSVRTIAAEELAAQLIPDNANEARDSLEEIAAWIQSHPNDAAAMNAAIVALQAIVDGIGGDGEKATVVQYVNDAIAALNIGNYALAADLTALAGRVSTLETNIAKKANDADLATIAKSGNVNDLVQTTGDVLILDCGNSTI